MVRAARLLVLLGAILGSAVVREAAADEAAAKTAYVEGVRHYERGAWAKARERFETAYHASHHRELLYNIGSCYRQEGDFEHALEFMRRYVASSGPSSVDLEVVRREIGELAAFVDPSLELVSRGAPGEVTIDGTPRGTTPLTVRLPKGLHAVLVTFERDLLRRLEVSLEGGDRKTIEVVPPKRRRTRLWIGIGVGTAAVAAAVIAGIVVGVRAPPPNEGTLDPSSVMAQP